MPSTNRSATQQDRTDRPSLYATVTARIVSELREGAAPWVRPWSTDGLDSFPRNGLTGRQYQGNNIVLLWLAAYFCGFSSNQWYTYLQAQEAGGQVRRGEKGIHILKAGRMQVKEDEQQERAEAEGEKEPRTRKFLRTYVVFNRDQIDGLPAEVRAPGLSEAERNARVEAFLTATGSNIVQHATRAFYAPDLDLIGMPPFARFRSASHFYAVNFHEHGHWTGAAHRLDRLPSRAQKGTPEYAQEELTAELVSAFLCAFFGVDGDLRHPGYLAHYIAHLENDEGAFFRAATAARHAADYLLHLTGNAPVPTAEDAETEDEDGAGVRELAQAA
ncbi:MAG TPA: ArdC-like ssDNA-binding domain-containing protein [Longimicrobium sp.]